MPTVRLLKDSEGCGRKGEVVSLPFLRGKEMVAAGLAERLPDGAPPTAAKQPNVAVPSLADRHRAEVERLNAFHASEMKSLREQHAEDAARAAKAHAAEVADLKAELEAARKANAELNAARQPAPAGGGARK